MSLRSLILTSIATLAVSASAHASTFGLAGYLGDTPTFSITSGGITATYSSPAGNAFAVQSTAGLLTFNTALLDSNFFGPESPLTISFSSPISGTFLIPFGFEDLFGGPDSLTVTANTGQTASFLGTPDNLALGEPEGVASFLPTAPVTSLTLNGTIPFAIGDIATVAPVPEPASIVLLATGMAGFVMRRRRA